MRLTTFLLFLFISVQVVFCDNENPAKEVTETEKAEEQIEGAGKTVEKTLTRAKDFIQRVKSNLGHYYYNFRLATTVPLFTIMVIWGKWVDQVTDQLNELSSAKEFYALGKNFFTDLNVNLYKDFKEKYFTKN